MTPSRSPEPRKATVAVDLGAESCRVSLLRWQGDGPQISVVHRFANGAVRASDGSLRWPLGGIVDSVEEGLRLCAELAPEGIGSLGVDGWAVDYVRLSARGEPLDEPYSYRDERTEAAASALHSVISADRLREITGLQPQALNTVYQLYADRLAETDPGAGWLNLPEYLLYRWSGRRVAEYTNATHTGLLELRSQRWSAEILSASGIDPATMPEVVGPGTILGKLRGPLSAIPAFKDTVVIAPACHDTASAVWGIPAQEGHWGYVSCGTWSLAGVVAGAPTNSAMALAEQVTNLGLDFGRTLLQKNLNGLWLLKQCMDAWADEGSPWEIESLCQAAENASLVECLLDTDAAELRRVGDMPNRIGNQLVANGCKPIDLTSAGAPAMAMLIFVSLAHRYAETFQALEQLTGEKLERIFMVGGGSRNALLRSLTEQACGKPVIQGAAESSTVGNLALQQAIISGSSREQLFSFVSSIAGDLVHSEKRIS